ncbi:MAG TPA: hypothetical protein PKA94_06290 [Ferruginibacter sp.]|jgi:hypothetical protein|nr:hypothetical protein [Ferruginibacter sp.]
MKTPFFILFIVFASSSRGQNSIDSLTQHEDTTRKYFLVGDGVRYCLNCTVNLCGIIINKFGDTIAKKSRPINSDDIPLYFTKQNVLLTQKIAKKLIEKNKVKSISIFTCEEGTNLFGGLANNGVIILDLKDPNFTTETLVDYLNRIVPNKNISIKNILINGLQTTDDKIKYPKWEKLFFEYDAKENIFNIKTE